MNTSPSSIRAQHCPNFKEPRHAENRAGKSPTAKESLARLAVCRAGSGSKSLCKQSLFLSLSHPTLQKEKQVQEGEEVACQVRQLMTELMTLESMFSGFPISPLPPQGSKITSEEKSLVPVTDGFLMCEQPEQAASTHLISRDLVSTSISLTRMLASILTI